MYIYLLTINTLFKYSFETNNASIKHVVYFQKKFLTTLINNL